MGEDIEYIYQIKGKKVIKKPESYFNSEYVYIVISYKLNFIWIWQGNNSKLFDKYQAVKYAMDMKKINQESGDLRYDVIHEGLEPVEFKMLMISMKIAKF